MRDQPIYSIEPDCKVYHNNTKCTERNSIEMRNMRVGTGGKKLCDDCRKLNIEWERLVNNLSGRNVFNSLLSRSFFLKK
jgi:hypothetical protein